MTEQATETTEATDATDEQAETLLADAVKAQEADQQGTEQGDDPRIKKANTEAANYRKQLRTAQSELEKLKQASMSDQEKAVAEAVKRGRDEALSDAAQDLVDARFRAAAARANVADDTVDGFLEFADPKKFLGEDGTPDRKAIDAAVKKLAGGSRRTDFDGGARTTAKTTDMNSLIRQKAGMG